MKIKYLKGDVTEPTGEGRKIIIQICNNLARYGAGLSGSISRKWPEVEQMYRALGNYTLGEIQVIPVEEDTLVINMIGQEGIGWKDGQPPIRYEALRNCLRKVALYVTTTGGSIYSGRLGAGLSGGKWELIEKILEEELCSHNIDVTIYDL